MGVGQENENTTAHSSSVAVGKLLGTSALQFGAVSEL
jgi:hypothetical protein